MEGADVLITARDGSTLDKAAAELAGIGPGRARSAVADLSTSDGPQKAVDATVEAFGGLQVLVANAGGPIPGGAADRSDADMQAALDLNFFSVVRSVRAALPHMARYPWGRVVAITSIAPKEPIATLALSNIARAATHGFLKTMSAEVASSGITINAVLPNNILTDRLRSLLGVAPDAGTDDAALVQAARNVPVGRLGSPDELGAVVTFLCSWLAGYVNGVSLTVDGGSARGLY